MRHGEAVSRASGSSEVSVRDAGSLAAIMVVKKQSANLEAMSQQR